jgi:flagellar hook-associated protein 1 FlgK
VDQLAKIVDITAIEDQFGSVAIAIGSRSLVYGKISTQLTTVIGGTGFYDVEWADGTPVNFNTGELQGLIYSRDTLTQNLRNDLNGLAANYISEVNAQHLLGFGLDGGTYNFFAGTDAATIALHSDISDLDHIAAAGTAPVADGDNANALLLAALKHDNTTMGTDTFDDSFRGMASQLGVDGQAAGRMVENQGLLISQLNTQQQQLSGVSLDEEMTNMIKFQHAYNAASRVVTSMDEMLETIISRMGLVGR